MRVTIVIPCYNEERRLPVDELRQFTRDHAEIDFLFVNDGSRDGTAGLLRRLASEPGGRFQFLDLERNRGKAEAVRLGVLKAEEAAPAFIGFWDADLATPLDQIPLFLETFATRPEIEIVMAARVRLLGRSISRRPSRHYIGRVGATLISTSLGLAVYDTQCGAKIFRVTPRLGELFGEPFLSRWLFDVEILARMVRQRGRDAAAGAIYELPITVWHDVPGSKVRSTDFIRALRDLLKIHRKYNR